MRRSSEDPEISPALESVAGLARDSVAGPAADEMKDGLRALFVRLERDPTGKPWSRRSRAALWFRAGGLGLVGVAAVAGIVLVSGRFSHLSEPSGHRAALAYEVEEGMVVAGGYLRQAASAGVKLSFNEGSEIALLPGARGRLLTVNDGGASIALEQGTASFRITPGSGRTWLVDVGPFLVTVKGTVFTVSWDGASERFELKLRRGRVVVSGPVPGGDIALRAGQRLVVNLPRAETLITELEAGAMNDRASGGTAPAASDIPVTPVGQVETHVRGSLAPSGSLKTARHNGSASEAGAMRGEGPRRWRAALAAGDWEGVLHDAEKAGVKRTLESASAEDLFALADAARYGRRHELARDALRAERRRFPDSDRTPDAAYLLGRVEEARLEGRGRALRWYEEYLTRAPSGTYASEALGRKMKLTNELEGPSRARPIAEQYLRRFPRGTYAGSAQALLHVP